jgi:peptidoglycan/LPS O-acetylase OafA/YrhL
MSKNNAAESIRGLACMAVVFSHLSLTFYPYLHNFDKLTTSGNQTLDLLHDLPFGFLYSGTGAVFVFFVLSGYVLSYAILSKKNTTLKIKSMALKRYPRLAIPAGFSGLVAFAALFTSIDSSHLPGNFVSHYHAQNYTLLQCLYEGFIGSFLFGQANTNFVLWTMQVELFASFMLFALLYVYTINKKLFVFLSLIAPLPFILISSPALLGAYGFVAGSFLFLYGKKIPTHIAMILLIVGLYCAGINETSQSYQLFSALGTKAYILLNFLSGLLIVSSVLLNDKISASLNKKSLVKLGELSFSIYLLHLPLICLIAVPVFNLIFTKSNSYLLAALLAALACIIFVLFSANFYSKYIDQLSIRVANKIESVMTREA